MELGGEAYGEVYNIGSQEEISILGLAGRVRELTASDSEIQLIAYEDAYEEGFEDMPRRYPDISKVAAALDWSPTRTLDEILGDVIDFHQQEAAIV
jgi:UDP-glucose 4-epimerase